MEKLKHHVIKRYIKIKSNSVIDKTLNFVILFQKKPETEKEQEKG